MKYKIKEIFFTQQGEGKNTGMNSVFIRFTGCNLWSGKEKNRGNAICNFCDTDFYGTDGVNGGSYTKEELLEKVKSIWMGESKRINVVGVIPHKCISTTTICNIDDFMIWRT